MKGISTAYKCISILKHGSIIIYRYTNFHTVNECACLFVYAIIDFSKTFKNIYIFSYTISSY